MARSASRVVTTAVALSLLACGCSGGEPPPSAPAPASSAAALAALAPNRAPSAPVPAANPPVPPPRELDFSPFVAALATLGDERAAALDALTRESDVPTLRARVAAGDVGARELTLLYLSRIRRLDEELRSVIELNPDALAEAARLDALRAAGEGDGPLHGIPILLKDNISTGDALHDTAGAVALADHRAPRDAFVVARLREAGAVILGKTNLSEWAYFMSSTAPSGFSALGGQVVNPHGDELAVLGSSTGSAVAAVARFAAATVGTETTGSIIAPAAANGVAGMRPTPGLVSGDLIVPINVAFDGAGPLGRHVADLAALLDVMAVRDDGDPNAPLAARAHGTDFTASLGARSLAGLRVGVVSVAVDGHDALATSPLDPAIDTLEQAGAEVVPAPVSVESLVTLARGQPRALAGGMARDVAAYLEETEADLTSLAEIIAFNEADPSTRAPYGQDLLIAARDGALPDDELARLVEGLRTTALEAIRSSAERGRVDVLLSIDNAFSLHYALAGTPAVTVPIGRDAVGQPHGATFVGIDRATDAAVLGIAHAFERAFPAREEPELGR